MRVALAQLNYIIGDFEGNINKIILNIRKAKELKADMVVFSELAISGYPPRDFLEFDDFIERCNRAVDKIAVECTNIAAIIGAPTINPDKEGKSLYNSALFLYNGKLYGQVNKTLLPNYDIFDEYRYFENNRKFGVISYKGIRIALTICEDIWNIGPKPLYVATPMKELVKQKPHLMINIAASPFNYRQEEIRDTVLRANVEEYKIPLVFVNHVGAQTEVLFDGNSKVLDAQGDIALQLIAFEEDLNFIDFELFKDKLVLQADRRDNEPPSPKVERIYKALVMGIGDYFKKMGFSKAILGLSGGIDSAVTLALASQALGPQNIHAVLLPSEFSSQHSIDDARALAENLNVPFDIIKISEAYESLISTMTPYFENLPFNVTEENMQARIRAIILMALANKFGYILLNTSNKSEAAVGYGTLYGDMCGGLAVLGDVYKTEVYELAHYVNRKDKIIPANSIAKPPSAELRPGQRDSDSLPEYHILDQILFNYIEQRIGPSELIRMGFDEKIVNKVLRLVNMNEWKRFQTPPILRVSTKAFGSGRRMPIVAKYLS